MCAMMPNTEDEKQNTELADKHDGVEVSREQISGTFEYEVVLTAEELEGLEESHMMPEDFAENLAVSRFNSEIDPTFTVSPSDAMAKEETARSMNDERRFTVWVRFDQNE